MQAGMGLPVLGGDSGEWVQSFGYGVGRGFCRFVWPMRGMP